MIWLQTAVLALATAGQGEPLLLDFTAVWCGPCRQMAPTIDRLAVAGCRVKKVDVDQNPALAEKYGVTQFPTFIVISGGREVGRVVGITSYDRLFGIYRRAGEAYKAAADARLAVAEPPPIMPMHSTPARTNPAVSNDVVQVGWEPRPATRPTSPVRPAVATIAAASNGRGVSDAELIAASVRIRVQDPKGQSCGTGTIIDAREGWALVLTCGHIFRDFDGKGRMEVDLFGPGGPQRAEGTLVSYNLERDRDIGLLRFKTPGPVQVARVAPPTKRIAVGNPVINVGCNNGDAPTARRTRIASMNKYLGPANIQAGGLPVEGRSGGGLFSADGLVVGVCNFADPKDNEGLYAAAEVIREELDRARLSFVYQEPSGGLGAGQNNIMLASATAVAPPAMPNQMPPPGDPSGLPSRPVQLTTIHEPMPLSAQPARPALSRAEGATLEEIMRRYTAGAKVVCVISSRANPAAASESITLGRSSAASLYSMAANLEAANQEAGRQPLGVEVVCVIRSRANLNTKSEIIVLDHGSSAFLRHLAGSLR